MIQSLLNRIKSYRDNIESDIGIGKKNDPTTKNNLLLDPKYKFIKFITSFFYIISSNFISSIIEFKYNVFN